MKDNTVNTTVNTTDNSTDNDVNVFQIPKNIHLVGKEINSNKRIYISKELYKIIFGFSKDKTIHESGGVLLGYVIQKDDITNIVVDGFIEAKHSEATSNTLTFTKETWKDIDNEREKYPHREIVGWMHTHPDVGCEISEYDLFVHTHIFPNNNQIAYIVDPVQIVEAFYVWQDDKIVKCGGFYLFGKQSEKKHSKKKKDTTKDKPGLESISEEATGADTNNTAAIEKSVIKEDLSERHTIIPQLIMGILISLLIIGYIVMSMQIKDMRKELEQFSNTNVQTTNTISETESDTQ